MRTEPGTVFSHLPFRTGDEYTPDMGTRAIHSLYRSGLFKDVSLSQDGDVLVVHIVERPAVATIETHGIKAFDKDAVETSLRDVGMAEGRIFDQATLDRADQELRRQYLARGYYGVKIKTIATPLERNRVRITINVDEGRASSIASIRFTGNRLFDADELLDQMQLGMPNWFSWYTKRDLYSREKLAADLETIRSFYMNQGYLDFKIDSVQVSIAPNKSDVYITINMTEGEKYTIAGAKLTGDLLGIDEELNKLLTLKAGEIYNAEQVNNVSTALVDKLSTLGYAFATATPNPIADRENRTVEVVYTIDPGRRAYVRRVNITGNNRTKDEVIRREVRQYESAWFDSSKVKLSRDRIDRLGYFESVTADPVPVPGTRDQVDVDIKVKERPTGSVSLGAGYSTSDGIILRRASRRTTSSVPASPCPSTSTRRSPSAPTRSPSSNRTSRPRASAARGKSMTAASTLKSSTSPTWNTKPAAPRSRSASRSRKTTACSSAARSNPRRLTPTATPRSAIRTT